VGLDTSDQCSKLYHISDEGSL